MPDSAPPPETPPPPRTRAVCWRRVRLYALGILLIFAIYLYAAARVIREHPHRIVTEILARIPYRSTVGPVHWLDSRRIELRDVKVGDFFYAGRIIITASPYQLWRHHIDEIEIRGGQFFTKAFNDALRQGPQTSTGQGGMDWTITKLIIAKGTLMLQDLAPDLPAIPVRLGVVQPIILNYVKLGHPDQSPSMTRERQVELENIAIVSPFDPLAPVLTFPLTRVRFTYAELWQHHLRKIELIRPVIFLGQDLFWFSEQLKKETADAPPSQGVDAPWRVGHFSVRFGQLAVNAFGQPAVQFPFYYDADVDDVRLDQLDKISAKTVIPFERFDADYTDYKIKIVNLHGQLAFNVPPSNANANNVAPIIHIDELSWNGIAATQVDTSVTFDPTGIYGKLSGKCEKGLLSGNFEVYYTKGFTWNADFFATAIDCAPIADKVAGQYGSLSGTIDGSIGVQGRTTEITHCTGRLDLRHPGILNIKSADALLSRLPGSTSAIQHQALHLAVDALRSYPYQTGGVKIEYTSTGGEASLHLDGPQGKRDFSVFLHPYTDPATSKVANADDSR